MIIDEEGLKKVMQLACLEPDPAKSSKDSTQLLSNLNDALALIEQIHEVDTKGMEPLSHPLDIVQPMREDKPGETIDREQMQKGAPQLRDGFYLVPRVVETQD
jgi:aspartyl-tRNA(Asn)/glutamyl-tRNA(Gln) amidotransferase subunit C